LPPGVDALSPENKLIVAAGPLTGLPGPSLGKLVLAAKSPLTGGYGDGNIGTVAAVHLRKAGYDAAVIEGKAEKPAYIYIENDKVIEFQRIRGGMFEALVSCRLPWIELQFPLEYYPRLLKAATSLDFTLEELTATLGDRIYALIRAFWIREKDEWNRSLDYPPTRWFEEPLSKGPYAGKNLIEKDSISF